MIISSLSTGWQDRRVSAPVCTPVRADIKNRSEFEEYLDGDHNLRLGWRSAFLVSHPRNPGPQIGSAPDVDSRHGQVRRNAGLLRPEDFEPGWRMIYLLDREGEKQIGGRVKILRLIASRAETN